MAMIFSREHHCEVTGAAADKPGETQMEKDSFEPAKGWSPVDNQMNRQMMGAEPTQTSHDLLLEN